jgi:uncharacterized protein (DUF2147 family)
VKARHPRSGPAAAARVVVAALLAVLAASSSVTAETVLGLWRTEPDAKGQTGHVLFSDCGDAYCGTIVAAQAPDGREIVTPNVGREVISALKPLGAGVYEGSVFVPVMNASFPATLRVEGKVMMLQACNAVGLCREQRWRRLD